MRTIEWTPLSFLWLLMMPGLLSIRSSLLVGADPNSIESYETHFYRIRIRFFALSVLTGCQVLVGTWVLYDESVSTFRPIQAQGLIILSVPIIGLISPRGSIHGAIALSSIIAPIVGFSILGVRSWPIRNESSPFQHVRYVETPRYFVIYFKHDS